MSLNCEMIQLKVAKIFLAMQAGLKELVESGCCGSGIYKQGYQVESVSADVCRYFVFLSAGGLLFGVHCSAGAGLCFSIFLF